MLQLTDKRNKVLIYLIFLLVLSTTSGKISKQPKKYSLKIDKIEVSGLSSSKNLEIQNDLSIFLYQNIFILQKENISEIINKHNIIEKYTIKKIYPSTLIIELKPTKFLAKIVDNKHLLVGEQNEKILPYISGKFNKKKFLKFKKNIETSKFNFSEFKTIYFFPSNRWDILTTDDILIKLPQGNIFEPLNLAYKIISNIQFKDKNIIDLRINNYLNVK